MDSNVEACLRLQQSGVSLGKQTRLVKGLGSPRGVFAATEGERLDHCERLTSADRQALAAAAQAEVSETAAQLADLGVDVVGYGGEAYPPLLAEIESAPPMLYVKGSFTKADELSVAIVGTRQCTPYGEDVTEKLAASLARRGFTVVSGLAVGIDAAAHRGTLDAGGRTIGVMACGIDVDYPKSNRDLRERMPESGAAVTEMALGRHPTREVFPQRNRIVAGLTLGTVVVEAPTRSGALITANLALDMGREVFAVPGPVSSTNSRGCHALIKDGARLVETVEDVVDGLGMRLQAVPERQPAQKVQANLSPDEAKVVDELSAGPKNLDQLVVGTGLPPATISAALMMLEVKQVIKRLAGGGFARTA